jgi:hypothetical protein
MTEDLPAMPEFNPKRTRRAVRRGIVRTASTVIAVLLAAVLVLTLGSRWIQERGDRERRMVSVLGTALQIANPGYLIKETSCCETSPLSMGFTVGVSPLRAHGGSFAGGVFAEQPFTVEQDFFGRAMSPPFGYATETTLTYGLYNVRTGNQPKEQSRRVLARLPGDMNALSVVEFAKPMTDGEAVAFAEQYDGFPDLVVYEDRPRATPITWGPWTLGQVPVPGRPEPAGGMIGSAERFTEGLREFRAWVTSLREYDDANLRRFGMDLARLRKASSAGLAYAYVSQLTPVKELRKIIEDPRVRTIRVADVAYDLDRG